MNSTAPMLYRAIWSIMEHRIGELPKPPKALGEQPRWAIPADGLPVLTRNSVVMKIVRAYPSGWDNNPVHARVDLSCLRFSLMTIDDALMIDLRRQC